MSALKGWHWNENDQLLDEDDRDVLTGWDDESVVFCRGGQPVADSAVKALIAAAPDLLAACESMMTQVAIPWDSPARITMVAAIKKARGE